jgi:hypothetical protein
MEVREGKADLVKNQERMELRLALESHDALAVHLREGHDETSVAVSQARAGVESLKRALGDALGDGYGECFWPGLGGGNYWWMFRRDDASLEVVVMWTRGGASGWQHVFRATDAAEWVRDRFTAEVDRIGLSASR